jgi:DegV family protein with EDD domain
MSVAIVTDSASDLTPEQVAASGITVVPLLVSFGDREYRAGVDLDAESFWNEMTREDAPFPRTAAAAPGTFQATFERLFADGADEIVYVGVGAKLSATIQSAMVARDAVAGRPIHIVDSNSACMGIGLLALEGVEMANEGRRGTEIAETLTARREQVKLYVVLETLEYLKRGGRISPARAAIGGLLSVKPIITLEDGEVDTADRPRTSGKARARLLELLSGLRPERVAILHGRAAGIDEFADELAAAWGFPRSDMSFHLIGSSVGPHVGPGAYGAVVLQRPG